MLIMTINRIANLGRLIKAISHLWDDRQGGNKNELYVFW